MVRELMLSGKKIVITRSSEQSKDFRQLLQSAGAIVKELPLIKVVPPTSYEELDKAISAQKDNDYYDWIIFTSTNAVKEFVKRLIKVGYDLNILKNAKIAAIGSSTARCLEGLSLNVDLIPEEYKAEGLIEGLKDIGGKNILIPRAKVAREVLPDELRRAGAKVDVVETYQNIADEDAKIKARDVFSEDIDIVTFTSSSTFENFLKLVDNAEEILKKTKIAAIGPITAKAANQNGFKVGIIAKQYTIEGLVEAIINAVISE